jgi:WD40 repeat protein
MDHSVLDKGKERVFEAVGTLVEESQELTKNVWVKTSDEVVIQIPAKKANKLDAIKGCLVQIGVTNSEDEPLPLNIKNSTLQSLLDLCNADGSVNTGVLSTQELDNLIMLVQTADFLGYSKQKSIIDKLLQELLKPESKERFQSGELNLDRLSFQHGLTKQLREKIERLSMIRCLQKEPRTLTGHTGCVYSVCVSSDGKHVVTGSDDNTAKIWDIKTGELVHTLSGHTSSILSVCVSPDGNNYVVTGSVDNTAKIWDIKTGDLVHTLSGHTDEINSVCVSPDGNYVVTGSWDNTAKIWDIKTGDLVHTLSGHRDYVISVCVSPDGKHVVTGSDDNTAKIWDLKTGDLVHTLSGHTRPIWSVCVSPDGKHVVTGSVDNTAKIWDIKTGDLVHTLTGHTGCVYSVCVSPDGNYVVTGSWDRTAKIWELRDPELEETLRGSTLEQLLLVAYSLVYPDEKELTADYEKAIFQSCSENIRNIINRNPGWRAYLTLRNGLIATSIGAATLYGGYKLYTWYKGSE